jgi:hypothetical protein
MDLYIELTLQWPKKSIWVMIMVFHTTFNNISDISWWSVILVEEAEEPAAASRVHHFCNLQSRARTHTVLVIGYLTHWATRALAKWVYGE